MATKQHLTVPDFAIFIGTVVLSLFVGIYSSIKHRHTNTVENYFLADRKLSVLPTALSLAVTFQGSLSIIGDPAEVYAYGLKYAYHLIGSCLSYVFAGFVIAPVFHPLRLTSVNRYFKLRYNDNVVRYLVLSLGIFYYVLYSGSVIFGTCVALDLLMGIPYWGTIMFYSIVTAIYTSIGGMQAVIWTDVLQITIMAMGVFAVIIKSCLSVGGMSNVLDLASSRLDMDDFRLDPTIRYQFWNLTIGSFFGFLVTCLHQPGIQRINSTPTVKAAQMLYVIAGIVYAVLVFCILFEGVTIFAYYQNRGCDPLDSGRIDSINQLIPLAVSDLFSSMSGLSGLFIAALSSAALSTLSSCLCSLGAVTYDDIIRERYPHLSEEKAIKICKLVVFLYGMVAMAFTALITVLPGSIINVTYALMGCVDGPTCAIFLVSIMYRKASTKSVVIGGLAGIACIVWINIGALGDGIIFTPQLPPASTQCCMNGTFSVMNSSLACSHEQRLNSTSVLIPDTTETVGEATFLQRIYSMSFLLYPVVGFTISTLVSMLVSFITPGPEEVDERCFFSFRKHIMEDLFGRDKQNSDRRIDVNMNSTPMDEIPLKPIS